MAILWQIWHILSYLHILKIGFRDWVGHYFFLDHWHSGYSAYAQRTCCLSSVKDIAAYWVTGID